MAVVIKCSLAMILFELSPHLLVTIYMMGFIIIVTKVIYMLCDARLNFHNQFYDTWGVHVVSGSDIFIMPSNGKGRSWLSLCRKTNNIHYTAQNAYVLFYIASKSFGQHVPVNYNVVGAVWPVVTNSRCRKKYVLPGGGTCPFAPWIFILWV